MQDVMDQFEGREAAAGGAAALAPETHVLQPERFASGANLDACIQFLNSALAGPLSTSVAQQAVWKDTPCHLSSGMC